jgi:NADPH-dependent 2,4-dienoyl-CoA reductase/sulfur reductase-like enzyme
MVIAYEGSLVQVRPGEHPAKPGSTRRSQPSVIVIGAGFAGLAAADELHALGCKVRFADAACFVCFQNLGIRDWSLFMSSFSACT